MRTKLLTFMLLLLTVGAAAQTSRRALTRDLGRTGSNYFAYPGPSQLVLTPAPAGYEPFYISHYGRHGSRYMTDNKYYVQAIGKLDTATSDDFKLKTGFVEVPVGIQWGPDLLAFRPYVFAEPFIGYQISSSDSGNATFNDWTKQAKNKFEYGFGLGGGLEITSHIQLSVQWFKNLGAMFGDNVKSAEATWNDVKDVKNFQGVKFSLAILF